MNKHMGVLRSAFSFTILTGLSACGSKNATSSPVASRYVGVYRCVEKIQTSPLPSIPTAIEPCGSSARSRSIQRIRADGHVIWTGSIRPTVPETDSDLGALEGDPEHPTLTIGGGVYGGTNTEFYELSADDATLTTSYSIQIELPMTFTTTYARITEEEAAKFFGP